MRQFFLYLFLSVALIHSAQNVIIKTDSLTYQIKEVTVNSIRANSKSAVTYSNVDASQINKRNLGQDLPYLLSLTPSFITTSDAGTGIGYTGYRVRGTDANRINVTINGVPLNDPESHGVFFVNMPDFASSLSSVQIQRGVGSSTNGAAAFGASINMQTQGLNSEAYGELSSSYGSFNTNKNTVKLGTGLMNDHWALDVRLSNITSDGYIQRAWVDMKSYYLAAGYFGEKTSLKFITFGGGEKTYQAWNGVYSDMLAIDRTYNEIGYYGVDANGNELYYDNQTDNYNQTHYQLHLNHVFNPKLYLNATAYTVLGKGYYEEYKSDRWVNEYGLQAPQVDGEIMYTTDLVRRKWLDNALYGANLSLNYTQDKLNLILGGGGNSYLGDHFGNVIWAKYANNLDVANEYYRSNSTKTDANVYLKSLYTPIEKLTISADLQYRFIQHVMKGQNDKYDWNSMTMRLLDIDKIFNFFNPKIGSTYSIAKNQDVYASFAVANREPNRNGYTESGVNDQPVSERLYDTEIGYKLNMSKFAFGVNAYYMAYDNQLVLTGKISEIGELLTSNVKDSYRAGIELTAGGQVLKNLKWDGNLSLSRNIIRNYEDVSYIWDENYNPIGEVKTFFDETKIAYSPEVVANSIFTYNYKSFEASFNSVYVGQQFLDNTSNFDKSIDAYFVNNLLLKYSISCNKIKAIDFQMMINNLFNESYETNGYAWSEFYSGDNTRYNYKYLFPQAPMNYLASVTIRF